MHLVHVRSYGGILAALLRYQYPSVFDGALAGSAPVYMTAGLTDSTAFYEKLTQVCIIVKLIINAIMPSRIT